MLDKFYTLKNKQILSVPLLALFLILWGVSYFHNSEYKPIYAFVSVCLFIVNLFCIFFVHNANIQPWQAAVLIITLGSLYNFILPACTVPDEDYHFANVYKVSNSIIYGNSVTEQTTRMLMRPDVSASLSRDYHNNDLKDYYTHFWYSSSEKDIYYENPGVIGISLTNYQYIFPALIISLCRILGTSANMMLFAGREFNLLLFAYLIFISLKILPQMRPSLLMMSIFPMTLVLAASYSYDSIIISAMILFYAMIIRCIKNNKLVSLRELVVISLLFILIIPIKLVYFPVILMFFLVKRNQFVRPQYKYLWISVVCIITVFIMIASHGDFIRFYFTKAYDPTATVQEVSISDNSESTSPDSDYDEEHIWTVGDIKSEPLEFIGVIFRSIFDSSNQLFMNISGYYFGWFSYQIPITIACIFPILFILSIRSDEAVSSSIAEKCIFIIIIVSTLSLVLLSMLLAETPYGFNTVRGVQGRYFIPILPLLSLILNRSNSQKTLVSPSKLVKISVLMNSVVILYLLNDVLS